MRSRAPVFTPHGGPKRGASRVLAIFLASLLGLAGCGGEEAAQTAGAGQQAEARGAAVVDGKIYAAVNGERRVWYVTHVERDGNWEAGSFWRAGPMNSVAVSVFGLAEKSARPTGKGDIKFSFVITDPGATARAGAVSIDYFADGYTRRWTSESGGAASITLNKVVADGDFYDLGGGFSGTVQLPDLGNAATDTDRPRQVEISEGSFAFRVRKFQRSP